jgi:hypothetical protein
LGRDFFQIWIHCSQTISLTNPGDFNWIFITKLGCEWAEGSDPSPEDQQGFFMALKGQVPQLDSDLEQYVQEAVMAYARGLFFASAVMIGAASE